MNFLTMEIEWDGLLGYVLNSAFWKLALVKIKLSRVRAEEDEASRREEL
jgi:hypothetical protein